MFYLSYVYGITVLMSNELLFATHPEASHSGTSDAGLTAGRSGDAVTRVRAALGELSRVTIGPMSTTDADETLGLLSQAQAVVTSLMHEVTRRVADSDTDMDPAEVLRQSARLPTRESKRIANTARQLSRMPKVRERLATGGITPAHADTLANAAEKVSPEVVDGDQSLLDAADRLSPDSFNRLARRWSERKLIEAGLDPLERQRRAREAKLWVEKETGLGVLMAKLPRPQYEQLRQAVDNHYMHSLRRDGATDRDPDEVRTPKQRLADVVFELLTNRDTHTGEFINEAAGIKAKAATQLIVTAPLGVVDGTLPGSPVEIMGVGPVPRSILESLTPDTELAGMIFDRAGRPLWLGRNQRLGNAAQRLAVAVRDGGCFECGAPMHRCELHHIQEWHRDQGPTDIDNLVAVCRRHHKWLETQDLKVRRTPNGYRTRPRTDPDP